MIKTKKCNKCKVEKPLTKYWRDARYKSGVSGICNDCKAMKRRLDPIAVRRETLKRDYKMTYEEYIMLLESQGNACKICKTTTPGGHGYWHIDHDHRCCHTQKTCGKCIRGILCVRCNVQIGGVEAMLVKVENSIETLIDYLNGRTDVRDGSWSN